MKKFMAIILVATMLLMSGCMSNEPCRSCDDTPTRGYKHTTKGKLYYCDDCSSDCELCNDDTDVWYSSADGITFLCNGCYKELKSYGWIKGDVNKY